jgi:hypothetical protein
MHPAKFVDNVFAAFMYRVSTSFVTNSIIGHWRARKNAKATIGTGSTMNKNSTATSDHDGNEESGGGLASYPLRPGFTYHVFLSHNSKDKGAIKKLKGLLESKGIRCWYDEDELRPGLPWQPLLEEGIRKSQSVIVAIANSGLGPWEDEEMQAALNLAVREKRPVIPLLLPESSVKPDLPMFLENRTWVDLQKGYNDRGIQKLLWGITGQRAVVREENDHDENKSDWLARVFSGRALGLCVIGVLLACLVLWNLIPKSNEKPLNQWKLQEDLAAQVATDLHDNESVTKSQLYVNQRGKFTLSLTSAASSDYIGRIFIIPFETEPTSITIEINIQGKLDIDKYGAFDGSTVNITSTVAKIEKASPVRASIYLDNAELTDLPQSH